VVKPLHIVRTMTPIAGGYQVGYSEIAGGTLRPGSVTARVVVLGAGSLGSTELLLRARQAGTLPHLSSRLGLGWSSNGDFLTPAIHFGRKVDPTRGPTITAAVDLLDGKFRGAPIFIEDGGLPAIAEGGLRQLAQQDGTDDRERALIAFVRMFTREGLIGSVMPWFAQSRDAADGRLSIRDNRLALDWNPEASKHTVDAVAAMHTQMAMRTGGMPLTPLTWTMGRELITPHPLGGCNMGRSAADGVVGANGEVFGHRNLFVADGAIVPKAIGLNPSRTIGALSEHIAASIVADHR
jgi:cholesterol oxidase